MRNIRCQWLVTALLLSALSCSLEQGSVLITTLDAGADEPPDAGDLPGDPEPEGPAWTDTSRDTPPPRELVRVDVPEGPDCIDRDGDGYGSGEACAGPDCDDGDLRRNPGAPEVCDGLDNDCDEAVDEDLGSTTCGEGICRHSVDRCIDGQESLCNPMEGAGEERCGDGLDNDCDGEIDEDCLGPFENLCRPCRSDETCGGGGNKCLLYRQGDATGYCGADCSVLECPPGYQCEQVPDRAGNIWHQCVSETGSCDQPPPDCDPPCPDGQVCAGGRCVDPGDGCVPDGPLGDLECEMYRMVNEMRATHFEEAPGSECPDPLQWDAHWAERGRLHSQNQADAGHLFHADFPGGQNCAVAGSVEQAMNAFMWGPGEDPCPAMSHHCNIMRCGWSHVGIGIVRSGGRLWVTQNFH